MLWRASDGTNDSSEHNTEGMSVVGPSREQPIRDDTMRCFAMSSLGRLLFAIMGFVIVDTRVFMTRSVIKRGGVQSLPPRPASTTTKMGMWWDAFLFLHRDLSLNFDWIVDFEHARIARNSLIFFRTPNCSRVKTRTFPFPIVYLHSTW